MKQNPLYKLATFMLRNSKSNYSYAKSGGREQGANHVRSKFLKKNMQKADEERRVHFSIGASKKQYAKSGRREEGPTHVHFSIGASKEEYAKVDEERRTHSRPLFDWSF